MLKHIASFFKKIIPPAVAVATIAMFGVFSVQMVFAAFSQPAAGAPSASNNVAAPLNVGTVSQTKSGSLWVDTFGTTGGATFVNGNVMITSGSNVGIGIASPGSRLQVKGEASKSGTGRITSAGTTVYGAGGTTKFIDELRVGDIITASSQTKRVTAISSQTQLTIDQAFSSDLGGSGSTFTYKSTLLRLTDSADADKFIVSSDGNLIATKITLGGATITSWPTGAGTYTLPTASATTLGGIKVGSGLAIDSNGILSVVEADPTVKTFAKTVLPTCTTGQVLKGDGTSLSCVTDAVGAGGGLTGSGTANTIAKWTATGLGDSIIQEDTTNKEIGIGLSPGYPLHVLDNGSTAIASLDNVGTSVWTGLRLARGVSTAVEKWFLGMNNSDDTLRLRRSGTTDDVVINTAGNVGIGIASPSNKLDVNGAIGFSNLNTPPSGAGIYQGLNYLQVKGGTAGFSVNNNANNRSNMVILDSGNVGIGANPPDANYKITTSGGGIKAENNSATQPAIYANNSGTGPALQVGAGGLTLGGVNKTSWPSSGMTNPMTTSGDIIYGGTGGTPTRLAGSAGFLKSTGSGAPSFNILTVTDIPNLDAAKITTGTLADARIASASTWNAKEPAIPVGVSTQYWRGDKTWQTFPTAAWTQGTVSGNSGLYTTTAIDKVWIGSGKPASADATSLSVTNSSTNAAIYAKQTNSSGYAGYFDGGETVFMNSNVGIGTTNPGSSLTVHRSTAGTAFAIRDTNDTKNTFEIKDNGDVYKDGIKTVIGWKQTGSDLYYDQGNVSVTTDAGKGLQVGDVSIKRKTPATTVSSFSATTVAGGALTSGTQYCYKITATLSGVETPPTLVCGTPGSGNNSLTLTWSTVTGATAYKLYGRPTISSGTFGFMKSFLSTDTSFTDTGSITPTTNIPPPTGILTNITGVGELVVNSGIGVGIDSPASRVHIKDGYNWGTDLSLDATGTAGGKRWQLISTGGSAGEGQGKFLIKNQSGGVTALTIDSIGNVGIGTANPADKLDVAGGIRFGTSSFSAGVGKLYTSATLGTVLTANTGSTNDMTIANAAGNYLIANPTGTNNTVLNPTLGNVGIGTANPGAMLDVEGDIMANGAGGAQSKVCLADGTNCKTAAAETDPQVGTLTAGKWCVANAGGTALDCTSNAPIAAVSSVFGRTGAVVAASGDYTVAQITGAAPLASPTFTGTVSGITKAMVGLGNVDNTADMSKPVSTAQQTALTLKANLASPTFTGSVTMPGTGIWNSVGNVGIGKTDPSFKLDVAGTISGNNPSSDGTGVGVYGYGGANGYGVRGINSTYGGIGVSGFGGANGSGVRGDGDPSTGSGVYGTGQTGVSGNGSGYGVFGYGATYGVYGSSPATAVRGYSTGVSGIGVDGQSAGSSGTGVSGQGTLYGVIGASSGGTGVRGQGAAGVAGYSGSQMGNTGVLGVATVGGAYAAQFIGLVQLRSSVLPTCDATYEGSLYFENHDLLFCGHIKNTFNQVVYQWVTLVNGQ